MTRRRSETLQIDNRVAMSVRRDSVRVIAPIEVERIRFH